jgi:hypothetical protein
MLFGVLVHHSVQIDRPIRTVSLVLANGFREWFSDLEDTSPATVGPSGIEIRKKVSVEFGEPVADGTWTDVPISWKATSVHQLLPLMTGKIELRPVDNHATRLTVCGVYEPLVGSLGEHVDDAFMLQVAEATVRDLAVQIAKRLETQV